ncbi:hypothetical protein [Burkholderia pseudomallei]|uniref:hypothetical protein n=6 Tax=Burkholderia pseudomallei TaxID=28450 RepID=UPI0015C2FDCC|nr:hypothetical protein [Burkholderia pseudomallei]
MPRGVATPVACVFLAAPAGLFAYFAYFACFGFAACFTLIVHPKRFVHLAVLVRAGDLVFALAICIAICIAVGIGVGISSDNAIARLAFVTVIARLAAAAVRLAAAALARPLASARRISAGAPPRMPSRARMRPRPPARANARRPAHVHPDDTFPRLSPGGVARRRCRARRQPALRPPSPRPLPLRRSRPTPDKEATT